MKKYIATLAAILFSFQADGAAPARTNAFGGGGGGVWITATNANFGGVINYLHYPKVEIKVEYFTNSTPPFIETTAILFSTNIISVVCSVTNSFEIQCYWTPQYHDLWEKYTRQVAVSSYLQNRIDKLTYPKSSSLEQWVWATKVYTVTESPSKSLSWTNTECLHKLITSTEIVQKIETNVTVKVEPINE
jgi:hypothetical protein